MTVGGAVVKQQLPFVVGILADLSGMPDEPLPPLADRKFVAIDTDNLDSVMNAVSPRLAITVENKLTGDVGARLNLELRVRSLDDFQPEELARQVAPLRQVLETRSKLADDLRRADLRNADSIFWGIPEIQKLVESTTC